MPLPRSLAGQLALLLVAALVAAQALGFALFAQERGTTYREAYREGVAARLVSLIRLIEDSPAELHERIAATASTAFLRVSLGEAAGVAENAGSGAEAVAARLASALARPAGGARVELAGEPFWRRGVDEDEGARPPRHRPRWLLVSIQLEDGRWLNAATARPRVPPLGGAFLASLLLSAAAVTAVAVLAVRRLARCRSGRAADASSTDETTAGHIQNCPRQIAGRRSAQKGDRPRQFLGPPIHYSSHWQAGSQV